MIKSHSKGEKIDILQYPDLIELAVKESGSGNFDLDKPLASLTFRDKYLNTNEKYRSLDEGTKHILANTLVWYVRTHMKELKGMSAFE